MAQYIIDLVVVPISTFLLLALGVIGIIFVAHKTVEILSGREIGFARTAHILRRIAGKNWVYSWVLPLVITAAVFGGLYLLGQYSDSTIIRTVIVNPVYKVLAFLVFFYYTRRKCLGMPLFAPGWGSGYRGIAVGNFVVVVGLIALVMYNESAIRSFFASVIEEEKQATAVASRPKTTQPKVRTAKKDQRVSTTRRIPQGNEQRGTLYLKHRTLNIEERYRVWVTTDGARIRIVRYQSLKRQKAEREYVGTCKTRRNLRRCSGVWRYYPGQRGDPRIKDGTWSLVFRDARTGDGEMIITAAVGQPRYAFSLRLE